MNNYKNEVAIYYLAAIFVLTVGVVFRFANLDYASLWSDELFTAAISVDVGPHVSWYEFKSKVIQELSFEDSSLTWKTADNTPPLYDILLIGWVKIFGTSDFALRSLSASIGSLVPICFFVGTRSTLGSVPALLGSAILAFNPSAIAYSQEVRAYILTQFLATIAIVNLVNSISNYRNNKTIATLKKSHIFVLILLSYSHYTGLFISGLIAAMYMLVISLPQRSYRDIFKFLIVPISVIPWMMASFKAFKFSSGGGYAWRNYSFSDITEFMIGMSADFLVPDMYLYFALLLAFLFGFSFSQDLQAVEKEGKLTTLRDKQLLFIFTIVAIIFMFGYSVYNSFTSKMWHSRYFSACIPLVSLSVALLFSSLTYKKWISISLLLTLPIFSSFLYVDTRVLLNPSQKPSREDYRGATSFVANNLNPDVDFLVLAWKPNSAYYRHYFSKNHSEKINSLDIYEISSEHDANIFCHELISYPNKGIVYMMRHGTQVNYKNWLMNCDKLKLISSESFLSVSVDKFRFVEN